MEAHRAVGAGLLITAALLIANPLYVYQHPDEVNEIRLLEGYDGPTDRNYTFEELSPRGQELFRDALNDESGRVVFHGDHRRPDGFVFEKEDQPVRVEGAVYRIEYEGDTYHLLTSKRPPLRNEADRSKWLVILGVLLGGVGTLYVRQEQPLDLGLAVGALGTVALASSLAHRYAHEAAGLLTLLGSAVVVVLMSLVTVIVGGYLLYRSMRERRLTAEVDV